MEKIWGYVWVVLKLFLPSNFKTLVDERNFLFLVEGYWIDEYNLMTVKIDLSAIKIILSIDHWAETDRSNWR